MRTLYQPVIREEITSRLSRLQPQSERQWGTMTAPQMLAHCSAGIEMALGRVNPPRALIGRILGPLIKPLALKDSEPMRRNSPTAKELIVTGDLDFNAERERLRQCLDEFVEAGHEGCTQHPHPFFGKLTAEAWGALMFKHLDHHLRQFNA